MDLEEDYLEDATGDTHSDHESPEHVEEAQIFTYNIFVGDLKPEVGEKHLREAFKACGPIHSANITLDKTTGLPSGYGFVHFLTKEAQNTALNPPHCHQVIMGMPFPF